MYPVLQIKIKTTTTKTSKNENCNFNRLTKCNLLKFQVLSTLHEYPCLETCLPLLHYISACVRLAWKMANHMVPYYLDQDFALGNLYFNQNLF